MMQVSILFGSCFLCCFFFVLGNQYISKVTSNTLSTITAVEMSVLLVKRQGRCNFKVIGVVLKLELNGKNMKERK